MTGGARPRQIGSRFEREVRDYFRGRGLDADRSYGAGRPDDVGDLVVGAWVRLLVECKAVVRSERGVWVREIRTKCDALRSRAGRLEERVYPVLVERRKGAGIAAAYVTLDLETFVDLVHAIARRVGELDEREA